MTSASWRRMNAAAWWVGARLCHRSSDLFLLDTYPGDGMYDVLSIRSSRDADRWIDLNRNGSMHVHGVPGGIGIEPLADLVHKESLEAVVASLEGATEWRRPVHGSRTTRRVATYRVLATVLQVTVDPREDWGVRRVAPNVYDDWGYDPTPQWSVVAEMHGAEEFRRSAAESRSLEDPDAALWGVFRDQAPVALFDSDGRALTDRGVVDVLGAYRNQSHGIVATTAQVLGHLLP